MTIAALPLRAEAVAETDLVARPRPRPFAAGRRVRPQVTTGARAWPVDQAKSGPIGSATRRSSHRCGFSQAHSSMPTSRRRAPFAAAHEGRTAPKVKVGLVERRRFVDAQPGSPEGDDEAAQSLSVGIALASSSSVKTLSTLEDEPRTPPRLRARGRRRRIHGESATAASRQETAPKLLEARDGCTVEES
jgi:hypothetical protein